MLVWQPPFGGHSGKQTNQWGPKSFKLIPLLILPCHVTLIYLNSFESQFVFCIMEILVLSIPGIVTFKGFQNSTTALNLFTQMPLFEFRNWRPASGFNCNNVSCMKIIPETVVTGVIFTSLVTSQAGAPIGQNSNGLMWPLPGWNGLCICWCVLAGWVLVYELLQQSMPWTEWLRTTENYWLNVLETGNPRSRF